MDGTAPVKVVVELLVLVEHKLLSAMLSLKASNDPSQPMIYEEQLLRASGTLPGLPQNLPHEGRGQQTHLRNEAELYNWLFHMVPTKAWYLLWEGAAKSFGHLASNSIKVEIPEPVWCVLGVRGPSLRRTECFGSYVQTKVGSIANWPSVAFLTECFLHCLCFMHIIVFTL